jgi:hypothetical protein
MEAGDAENLNKKFIATGEQLLAMNLATLGDTKNFLVGVNNIASQLSLNSELFKTIDSASLAIRASSESLMGAVRGVDFEPIARQIGCATVVSAQVSEMIKLSESVTTVLAYGQAVQSRFDSVLGGSVALNSIVTVVDGTLMGLGRTGSRVYAREPLTSPFVFTPQKIETKEITKTLPEVKKDLPAKTTEAIELMEYIFDQGTKNDDQKIVTTVAELKRAVKNIQGSVSMFFQQTTQKIEIFAMPEVQIKNVEDNAVHKNGKRVILPKFGETIWENITIRFLNKENILVDTDKTKNQPHDFQSIGFVNEKTAKPDLAWILLYSLAIKGGELPMPSPISNATKEQKKILSNRLKALFNNQTEPFHDAREMRSYKIKINLIAPESGKEDLLGKETSDFFDEMTAE